MKASSRTDRKAVSESIMEMGKIENELFEYIDEYIDIAGVEALLTLVQDAIDYNAEKLGIFEFVNSMSKEIRY